MECPECERVGAASRLLVKNTVTKPGTQTVVRYRYCNDDAGRGCQMSLKTLEQVEAPDGMTVQKSGIDEEGEPDTESFERGKIRTAIRRASPHRLQSSDLDALVDRTVDRVRMQVVSDPEPLASGADITTQDVSRHVLDVLEEADPVIFVRYTLVALSSRSAAGTDADSAAHKPKWQPFADLDDLEQRLADWCVGEGQSSLETIEQIKQEIDEIAEKDEQRFHEDDEENFRTDNDEDSPVAHDGLGPVRVVKRNGRRQPFSQKKLEQSIGYATKRRGAEQVRGEIHDLARHGAKYVMRQLQNQPLVTSDQIAAEILRYLDTLNTNRDPEVDDPKDQALAYLRVASTHKKYRSAHDYLRELVGWRHRRQREDDDQRSLPQE